MASAPSQSTDFPPASGLCSIICKSSCTFFITRNASSTASKTCGETPLAWPVSRLKEDAKLVAARYFFCGVGDPFAAGVPEAMPAGETEIFGGGEVGAFAIGAGGAAAAGVEALVPAAPGVGDASGGLMLRSSTSKTSVEFGPMSLPTPRSPYPSADGMKSWYLEPGFIISNASVQPLMTRLTGKVAGSLRL